MTLPESFRSKAKTASPWLAGSIACLIVYLYLEMVDFAALYRDVALIFSVLFALTAALFVGYHLIKFCLYLIGDACGFGEGGRIKSMLRERGYDWVGLWQARRLGERCGWKYDWIKKLPSREEVILTPVYQGDSIESLAACALILLERD